MRWYSYNGIILPELPIWDTFTYPYAAIYFFCDVMTGFSAELICSDIPFEYDKNTGYFVQDDASVIAYNSNNDDNNEKIEWKRTSDSGWSGDLYERDATRVIWTNQDMFDNTGYVYMNASAPVSVETISDGREYQYLGDISEKVPDWKEWDKETYPYAIVVKYKNDEHNIYTLMCSDKPIRYEESGSDLLNLRKAYEASNNSKVIHQYYVSTFNSPTWSMVKDIGHFRVGGYEDELTVVWHTALYNEADEVVVEASPEPRKKYPIVDWITGYILGGMEPPRPISSQGGENPEPIAYSYNGVKLPPLPDAPEGHEFILLHSISGVVAVVYYSTTPLYLKTVYANGWNDFCAKEDGEYIRYYYDTSESLYGPYDYHLDENGPYDFVAGERINGFTSYRIRWANYDVRRYDDDTIWLAKTEPIPVYE